ncbi:hypothetical protein H311_01208, partial [Anncaliia algerae PRA109]
YNTDDSTYIDTLDDETILNDNYSCTNCEKNKEPVGEIIDSNLNSFSHPKIIKESTDKHNIPYGEIVFSVYENPLNLMPEDFILDSVECRKEENVIEDYKLSYGEIICVADQETTDLVSRVYTEENDEQKNEALVQNMNPLINNNLNTSICKEKEKDKDLNKYDTKCNSKKEEAIGLEDKDNGVLAFSIVSIVVLVVLNM